MGSDLHLLRIINVVDPLKFFFKNLGIFDLFASVPKFVDFQISRFYQERRRYKLELALLCSSKSSCFSRLFLVFPLFHILSDNMLR